MQYTPAELPQRATDAPGISSVLTRGRKLMIVGSVMLLAFGYFAFTAFQSATAFYLTVDELVARGPSGGSEALQVKGSLVEGSFAREDATSTFAHFLLEENGERVQATYDGVLPDLFFNPHSQIVLGGTYGPEGVFAAERVYIKCPSKYRSLETVNPYDDAQAA